MEQDMNSHGAARASPTDLKLFNALGIAISDDHAKAQALVVGDPACELRCRASRQRVGTASQNHVQVGPMRRRFPFAALFLTVAVSMCAAQSDASDLHIAPRIQRALAVETRLPYEKSTSLKVDVDLVLVPVTVTDRQDRLVLGLEKDNFTAFEGGNQQLIRHFSSEDAPVSLGVIFDTSSSMYGKMERSREAVVQFLRSSNAEDEFFLVGFNDRPELLVDFTSSIDDVQQAIFKLKPDGTTALLDAIYLGLDRMRNARNERKVLLVVSDGGDNHSRYTIKEVWPVLREAGVQLYAMGIFDAALEPRQSVWDQIYWPLQLASPAAEQSPSTI
jgi:hypothetical protein